MALQPGTLVRDGLRLVRELGSGAMGSVWVAQHEQLGTEVAVKFIHRDLDRGGGVVRARLQREAKAAAQIRSPHAVKVFDAGVMPDHGPYIVMEKLEGISLGEHIARVGRLSLRDTAEVVAQVGQALHEAHQRDIIHRDIKPDNIFLVRGQNRIYAKVVDFGLAKSEKWSGSGKLTNPEDMVGTPAYLSRETILAQQIDHRVDLWALAIVAYECLTGEMPFDGASMALICVAICDGKFTPPSAIVPEVPASVDAFFARAFALLPEDRYPTAENMALALLHCASPDEVDRDNARRALQQSGPFQLPPPSRRVSGDYTTLSLEVGGRRLAAPHEARRHRNRAFTALAVGGTLLAVSLAAFVGYRAATQSAEDPVAADPAAADPTETVDAPERHVARSDTVRVEPVPDATATSEAEPVPKAEGARSHGPSPSSADPDATSPLPSRDPTGKNGAGSRKEAEGVLGF